MGGSSGTARDLVLGAAKNKQHVVTANKALIAAALPELTAAFPSRSSLPAGRFTPPGTILSSTTSSPTPTSSSRRRVVTPMLGYEAAVAGGIPIIRALRDSLSGDEIRSVKGILNGTTNYILTKMKEEGMGYEEALKGAQEVGFAETDPTADVEGHDARNKLVILARLAFGVHVPPERVFTSGITGVTALDFALADDMGYTIKLLGVAEAAELDAELGAGAGAGEGEGEAAAAAAGSGSAASSSPSQQQRRRALEMFVSPALVPDDGAFGTTTGGMNHVVVDSDSVGQTTYSGAGAGRFPTANSVIADLVGIATGTLGCSPFPRPAPSRTGDKIVYSEAGRHIPRWWYVRAPTEVAARLAPRVWEDVVDFTGSARDRGQGYDGLLVAGLTRAEITTALNRACASAGVNPKEKSSAAAVADGDPASPVALFALEGGVEE
jgi:homoserine dehydrogenase